MDQFINSLYIKNYRGVGDDAQKLHNLKKINLFVGANNAGKSTVLKLVETAFPLKVQRNSVTPRRAIDPLDRHQGGGGTPVLGYGHSVERVLDYVLSSNLGPTNLKSHKALLGKYLNALSDDRNVIWWEVDLVGETLPQLQAQSVSRFSSDFSSGDWHILQTGLSRSSGGNIESMNSHALLGISSVFNSTTAKTHLIPAIREVGEKGGNFDLGDMSGAGLIDRLAQLQNPNIESLGEREKFDSINVFLRSVTGERDANIEIPSSRDYILVHMNGRVLPLSSLGTGIHEVVMLAAYCTLVQKSIVCIEEPEIHLHPLMQRKLIQHLNDATDNQYLIATHSAALIDTPGASVYRVKLSQGKTVINEALLDKDRFDICRDLGCRASDLVQTNAIVWVEGPSDRIYINHWIRAENPELREGLHYSVMFYGGRLLSHLSADDDDVEEFIKLRSLNRNVALIMDSDKVSPRKGINQTKRRLQREFSKHGGISWLTQGREIENYVEASLVEDVLSSIYRDRFRGMVARGQFDHILHFFAFDSAKGKRGKRVVKSADKVKVARLVCESRAQLGVLDLRVRVRELVRMIEQANT